MKKFILLLVPMLLLVCLGMGIPEETVEELPYVYAIGIEGVSLDEPTIYVQSYEDLSVFGMDDMLRQDCWETLCEDDDSLNAIANPSDLYFIPAKDIGII